MQEFKDLFSSSRKAIIFASAASVIGATVGYQMWRSAKLRITGDFTPVGIVNKVIIYPIKSLPGVEVNSAFITETGLRYGLIQDRSFMLQKEGSGLAITLRQEPSLALLKLSLGEDCMYIDGSGMNTLRVPLKTAVESGDKVVTCRLYGQDVQGIVCSDEVNEWFQKYLGKPGFRLLHFVPSFRPRQILNNLFNFFKPGQTLYHDDSSYLVLSEASMKDLNEHLEEKVSFKNFRPNFLLTNCEAYAEDKMKFAKVGEGILLFTTQCPRCILTMVNPETGVKNETEPLTTLRTYRLALTEALKKQYGNSPLFGVYMGVRKEGKVSVGDEMSAVKF